MKKSIFLFLFISFLGINCSKDSVSDPGSTKETTGTVFLQIDTASPTSDAVYILTAITRNGYANRKDSLNIESEITPNPSTLQLPTGTWTFNLKVFNGSNAMIASQNIEVPVYEDNVTNVDISLAEEISLKLSWGNAQFDGWKDYYLNPILTYTFGKYENYGILQPKIIFENGIYKMWYMGLTSGDRGVVCYAESQDGLLWTRPVQNPVMSYGNAGSWDDASTWLGAVLRDDSNYKMYYWGWNNQNKNNWSIGLATSADGKTWSKYPNPILTGAGGWENEIAPASILKMGDEYFLYYFGIGAGIFKIGLAISSDGVNFTRYSGNPILEGTEEWEGKGVFNPSVIKDGNVYKMVYTDRTSYALGVAISDDGKKWVKSSSNPFLKSEDTINHWAWGSIMYPFFIKVDNEYRIYYCASGNSSTWNIGVLIKKK